METIAVGFSALLVAFYTRSMLPSRKMPDSNAQGEPRVVRRFARQVATAIGFETSSVVAFYAFAPLDNGEVARPFFEIVALLWPLTIIVPELVLIVRLSRTVHLIEPVRQELCRFRNFRLGLYGAIGALLGVGVVCNLKGVLDALPLFGGLCLTAYFWTTDRLLIQIEDLVFGVCDGKKGGWLKPRSAIIFGGLVLIYHILMKAGRNFASIGPTEIIMALKSAMEHVMLIVAIWAFAALALKSWKTRLNASPNLKTIQR